MRTIPEDIRRAVENAKRTGLIKEAPPKPQRPKPEAKPQAKTKEEKKAEYFRNYFSKPKNFLKRREYIRNYMRRLRSQRKAEKNLTPPEK